MKNSIKKISALFLAVLFVLTSIIPSVLVKPVEAAAGDAAYAAVWPMTGAEYTVYSTRAAAETARNNVKAGREAGTAGMQKTYSGGNGIFTIAANGNSQELEFDVGTYYVVETKVPKGWNQDETVHELKITPDGTATITSKETPDFYQFRMKKQMDASGMPGDVDSVDEYTTKYPLTGAQYAVFTKESDAKAVQTAIRNLAGQTSYPKTVSYSGVAKDMNGNDAVFTIKADGTSDYRWLDEDVTYYIIEVKRAEGYLFDDNIYTNKGEGNVKGEKTSKDKPGTTWIRLDKSWARDAWVQEENPDAYNLEITWTIYKSDKTTVVATGKTDPVTGKMIYQTNYSDGKPAVEVPLGMYYVEETAVAPNSGKIWNRDLTLLDLTDDSKINTLNEKHFKNHTLDDMPDIPLINKVESVDEENFYSLTIQGTQFNIYYIPNDSLTEDDLFEYQVEEGGTAVKKVKDSIKSQATHVWTLEAKDPDYHFDEIVTLSDGTQKSVTFAGNEIYWRDEYVVKGSEELFHRDSGLPATIVGTYVFEEVKSTEGFATTEPKYWQLKNNADNTVFTESDIRTYDEYANNIAPEPHQTITIAIDKESDSMDDPDYVGGSLEGAEFLVEFFNPYTRKWGKATPMVNELDNGEDTYIITTDADGHAETYPMKPGQYRFKEVKAPSGYVLEKMEYDGVEYKEGEVFNLPESDGSTVNNGQHNFYYTYSAKNYATKQPILKVSYNDEATLTPLAGATLQIYELVDGTPGRMLKEWVTTEEAKVLKGLEVGKTYRITEVAVPEGYLMPEGEDAYKDITIENKEQQIKVDFLNEKIPQMRSMALSKDKIKEILEGSDVIVKDHFWVWDLLPNSTYRFSATIRDAETEEVVANSDVVEFTTDGVSTEYDVEFSFNATGLSAKKLVVTGELYRVGRTSKVATHYDLEDFDESVIIPEIGTYAFDNAKEEGSEYDKVILNDGTGTIKDRIDYKQLINGDKYIAETKLVDYEGNFIQEGGKDISARTEITADGTDGSVYVTIEIDSKKHQGNTLTVYEYIYKVNPDGEEILVGKHEDPTDEKQQVKIPEIKTTASEVVVTNEEDVEDYWFEITDIVEYNNMPYDKDVIGAATVMDPTTGEALVDEDGNTFTAETEFNTGGNGEGFYTVTIKVPYKLVEGKDVVMFETIQNKDKTLEIAHHHDWEDKNQTVEFPEIRTTAWFVNENGEEEALTKNNLKDAVEARVKDIVKLNNLEPGADYQVSAELYKVNKDGEFEIVASAEVVNHKAAEASSEVVVDFGKIAIPATESGDKFVVMEYLYKDGLMVGKHFEKNDEDQTIRKPDFRTTAEDAKDGDKYIYNNGDQKVIDVFKYEDLTPGVEVVVDTYLVDLEGNELKDAEGNRVSVETKFTPEATNGEIKIEIPVDGKFFEGQVLTVFEDVYENGVLIGVHHDLSQENQTVYVPEIRTKAAFSEKKDADEFTFVLTDVVDYKNFEVGQTYIGEAKLMDPETKEVFKDETGKEYVNEVEFTSEETSGQYTVSVEVPARLVEGKTFVFFEKAYRVTKNEETEEVTKEEEPFAEHNDWEDKDQTLHIPSIRTKAELASTFIDEVLNKIKIKDTISFKNFEVGTEYMFVGTLMDKETGEVVKDKDGNVITANAKIRPETADGTIDVVFAGNADDLVGKEVVVFEDAFINYGKDNQERVAIHRDINDKDQTVDIPMELVVTISKADKGNVKYFIKGAEITIFNEDGTVALDKNGKECVGVTDKDGQVKFHVLYGKGNKYYAQETKAPAGYHINKDKFEVKPGKDAKYKADINIQILDQAIIIPPVKTGDTNNIALWISLLAIAAAGITGVFVYKRRKASK